MGDVGASQMLLFDWVTARRRSSISGLIVITRKGASVNSFLQRSFGFPNLHCAVTDKKNTHRKKFNKSSTPNPGFRSSTFDRITSLQTMIKSKRIHMSLFCDSLWGGEQLAAVGGQAVDGTVVPPDLTEGRKWVNVPEAQQPSSASAEQYRGAWHHAQSANPVCLSTGRLLEETTARFYCSFWQIYSAEMNWKQGKMNECKLCCHGIVVPAAVVY